MHEKAAGARRIVILVRGGIVWADVRVSKIELIRIDRGVRVHELRLGRAQRLDLTSLELDSRLERLDDRVVVARLAVARDDLALVVIPLGFGRRAGCHRILLVARSVVPCDGARPQPGVVASRPATYTGRAR